MAPLQPQTKKWQIFSNRHFNVHKGFTPTFHPSTEIRTANPHITELETQKVLEIRNPSKGAGPDGLFPKALKTPSPYIASTLSYIFNLSLQTSQIPDDWLNAIVTPVAKVPRTTDPNLFKPISLASVVCKVLGAIFKEKILAKLSQFLLLTSRQHGYLSDAQP